MSYHAEIKKETKLLSTLPPVFEIKAHHRVCTFQGCQELVKRRPRFKLLGA